MCRQELARERNNPGLLFWLGRSLGQLWCYPEAQRALNQAARLIAHQPKMQAVVWHEIGALGLRRGRHGTAQKWYEKALQAHSGSARHWLGLGVCQGLRGQLKAAEHSLSQGLRRRHELSWENHYWMGWVLRAQERFSEAAGYLARGSEAEAEDCRRVLRASQENQGGRAERPLGTEDRGPACRLARARHLSRENPHDASYLFAQASALSEMGRLAPAIHSLRKAWNLIPLETYKWSTLGLIYADCNRFEKAAQCYERSQPSQYPGNWIIRSGLCRAQAGQREAAELSLTHGLTLETTYQDEAHVGLGLLCCGGERYGEAEAHFSTALNLNPDNQEAAAGLLDVRLVIQAVQEQTASV